MKHLLWLLLPSALLFGAQEPPVAAAGLDVVAPEGLAPLDVGALIEKKEATCSGSPFDIGSFSDIFDGDDQTLGRSQAINPMVIDLSFKRPHTFYRFGVRLSHVAQNVHANSWKVEVANDLDDLEDKTGSYRLAVDWTDTAGMRASFINLSAPITGRVVRLKARRNEGDDYVHLNEFRLFEDVLQLQPGEIRLDGTLLSLFTAKGVARMQVKAFALPNGKSRDLKTPRHKTLVFDDRSAIYYRGQPASRAQVFDSSPGTPLVAIGRDPHIAGAKMTILRALVAPQTTASEAP